MKIKAIILDLDNTIYPAPSIAKKMFQPLFKIIEDSGDYKGSLEEIKTQLMRQPFQKIAEDFSFGEELKSQCLQLLKELRYEGEMKSFDGYQTLQNIPCKKYLVTTGFTKMQNSKIDHLNIRNDFEKIYVVDPTISDLTKKDIFKKIVDNNNYKPGEVLIIGDDLESEIKAGKELGLNTLLYNHNGEQDVNEKHMITSFKQLGVYIN